MSDELMPGCRRVVNAPLERALVQLAALVVALACWSWIEERIGGGLDGSGAALAGARLAVATAAAVLVAVRGLFYVAGMISTGLGNKSPGVVTLFAPVGIFVLVALAWDQSASQAWQWLVLLAFVPALRWVELVARLLFAVAFLGGWGLLARFFSPAEDVTYEETPEYESGAGTALRGEEDPRLGLALALSEQSREERWIGNLTRGLALPLAIAFFGVAQVF